MHCITPRPYSLYQTNEHSFEPGQTPFRLGETTPPSHRRHLAHHNLRTLSLRLAALVLLLPSLAFSNPPSLPLSLSSSLQPRRSPLTRATLALGVHSHFQSRPHEATIDTADACHTSAALSAPDRPRRVGSRRIEYVRNSMLADAERVLGITLLLTTYLSPEGRRRRRDRGRHPDPSDPVLLRSRPPSAPARFLHYVVQKFVQVTDFIERATADV